MPSPHLPSLQEGLLQRVRLLLRPVVRLLLRFGIDHPRLAAALKQVFVEEAAADLARRGHRPTLTAISLLSGLQRRDVRGHLANAADRLPPRALSPSLPMQALARWANDPSFGDATGRPLPLPLRGTDPAAATFERLADAVSTDVHAPALLGELVRLGLVRVDDDGLARLLDDSFVPSGDLEQALGALARNAHDHLAAAVANVQADPPPFLEYSLVADELRPESVEALQRMARRWWRGAYRRGVRAATGLVERDRAAGFTAAAPEMRLRFGVYFYAEPLASAPTAAAPAAPETPEAAEAREAPEAAEARETPAAAEARETPDDPAAPAAPAAPDRS